MTRTMFAFILAIAVLAPVTASAATWEIDPTHTGVTFKVRHFFTKVPGKFTDVAGSIIFDAAKPDDASAQVTIQAASITTANEKRDQHLRSQDFFWAEKHPELTFTSTSVKKAGDALLIEGLLTMRGVEKPVTLTAQLLGSGPDAWGNQRIGFSATASVNRKDFGISWNKALDQGGAMLGDDVEIQLDVEAVEKKEEGGGW